MKICRRLRIASFLFPECLSNRAGRPLYPIDLLANSSYRIRCSSFDCGALSEPALQNFTVDFLCASRYLSKAKLNVRVLCIYEELERFSEVPMLVSYSDILDHPVKPYPLYQ